MILEVVALAKAEVPADNDPGEQKVLGLAAFWECCKTCCFRGNIGSTVCMQPTLGRTYRVIRFTILQESHKGR